MNLKTDSITVLGAGSWGTALAITVANNVKTVKLWGHNPTAMKEIRTSRSNTRYLPGISFPGNIEVHENLDAAIDRELCFLIVVPSHAFQHTLKRLQEAILNAKYNPRDSTIIWGTKGFDTDSGKLLGEVIVETFGETYRRGVISGPSFAMETAKNLPTALTLASTDYGHAESLAQWFRTPTIRVYHSDDPIGVQLGGAIKNVMAIAAGISDGLGYGANARAALITRGLSELTRLGIAMEGQSETFMGLTGLGDLILTCTDNQSRNRRFGIGIGQGMDVDKITQEIGQEIEGINTTRELYAISQKLNVEMPITEQVYKVLHENDSPGDAVKRLLQRNPKAEAV